MKDIIVTLAHDDLGIPASTISKWRERGAVPHSQRVPLIEAAKKRRKRLKPSDFEWETRKQQLAKGRTPAYAKPIRSAAA